MSNLTICLQIKAKKLKGIEIFIGFMTILTKITEKYKKKMIIF